MTGTARTWTLGVLMAATLALPACQNMDSNSRTVAGVAGGAAAGLITAQALGADKQWRTIAALAGAAAGTVVAQNASTGQCAVARGDGTYYTVPCR